MFMLGGIRLIANHWNMTHCNIANIGVKPAYKVHIFFQACVFNKRISTIIPMAVGLSFISYVNVPTLGFTRLGPLPTWSVPFERITCNLYYVWNVSQSRHQLNSAFNFPQLGSFRVTRDDLNGQLFFSIPQRSNKQEPVMPHIARTHSDFLILP